MKSIGIITALLALVLTLVACGSRPTPNSNPNTGNYSGTWSDTVKNQYGIVRMQYKLSQDGNTFSGEAFASKQAELVRVGTVTGSVAANGKAELELTFDDNGAKGSAVLQGAFSGNSFSRMLRTFYSNGNPNQVVSQDLVRGSSSSLQSLSTQSNDLDLQ
jgi:major membrane immunogen (membrane-anchored lipoprotein)